MKTSFKIFTLGTALIIAFCSIHGFAMDGKERLAIIKALKIKGIVGENNKGLLEFRSHDAKFEAVINEENAERTKVYKEVAANSGSNPDSVGTQRASQIAAKEEGGVWIQDSSGKWVKK